MIIANGRLVEIDVHRSGEPCARVVEIERVNWAACRCARSPAAVGLGILRVIDIIGADEKLVADRAGGFKK